MRALLVLALSMLGCSCDHGPPVPFGLEGQRADVVPAESETPVPPPMVADTVEWPDGADVVVGGATLAIPGASIRSTLATDLDADGDADAILVTLSPEPALFTAIRGPTGFEAPTAIELSAQPVDATCTWARAAFVAAARGAAVVSLDRQCPSGGSNLIIALRLDARPRVLETFTFESSTFESGSVSLADRDGDGHEDLALALQIPTAADGPATAELVYFDRPAGLSRDTAQPEASLSTTAAFERPVARRHPDRLAPQARRTVALHAALCGPSARISIGSARGIACGPSLALGHAFVVLAAASALGRDTVTALDAFTSLDRRDLTVRDVDRTLARDAITRMGGTLAPPAHDGPEARAVSTTPEQRLSTLAFLDEDRVLIRGTGIVTLSTGAIVPETSPSDTALLDPSGRFRLVELRSSCSGPDLVIEASGSGLGGRGLGGVGLDTELTARRAIPVTPLAAPCRGESGAPALHVDGLRVLGWAPQGVLLARGTALTLVPLDVEARPAGDPSLLALDVPSPAPIAVGHATADASAWALATPLGIAVFRRAEQDARLVRPVGFVGADGTAQDVAISQSTERIAWIEGGHLRWAALSEPTPTPVPPPSTP